MNTHFLYLISFLVVILPALGYLFYRGHQKLSKHWHVPLYVGLLGLVFAASEGVAFDWQIWQDNPSYILPYRLFNAQLETYILNFLVFALIACSTIILMGKRRRPKKR